MNQLTREDLAQFCGNLQYRLKLLGQTRLHTDRLLATRFNVFDYIQPSENGLSDIIADLLRPGGRHGQGDAFLKEFIGTMDGTTSATWKSCAVYRERATTFIENSQRRLDVLIELDGFGVAIENKPWAGEQHEQIHDYVAHLHLKLAGQMREGSTIVGVWREKKPEYAALDELLFRTFAEADFTGERNQWWAWYGVLPSKYQDWNSASTLAAMHFQQKEAIDAFAAEISRVQQIATPIIDTFVAGS